MFETVSTEIGNQAPGQCASAEDHQEGSMSGHQSAERRRHERRSVQLPGQLIIGDQSDDCVVFDISAGGAVVTSQVGPTPDQSVRLKLIILTFLLTYS